jgi:hypothetical protein
MGANSRALKHFFLSCTHRIEPNCPHMGLDANLSLSLSTDYPPKSLPENVLRFSPVVTGVLQIPRTRV